MRKSAFSASPRVAKTTTITTSRTIKHPEMAWLTKHWLYVTTDGGETTEHLYLLRVTRIQRQEQAA